MQEKLKPGLISRILGKGVFKSGDMMVIAQEGEESSKGQLSNNVERQGMNGFSRAYILRMQIRYSYLNQLKAR